MQKAIYIGGKICKTQDIGTHGNLFGGNMLAWADEMAAIYARITTGEPYLVTLKMGEVLFKHPVKVGELVEFFAYGAKLGCTSISFDIEAQVEGKVVFRTDCVFVALDDEGNKKEISRSDNKVS